ncbi:MAG: redox-sensing transcriptional repressor Rex [Firmicutes bacterium]|nr:redox-sensing transcriptional repressor Rex [Bacillota bacterium]
MKDKKVPAAVIQRMPRYYRYLGDLLAKGASRVSSAELSRRMGITASQIRQDLNHFGGFGQQGYGYNVEVLYNEIGRILGQDQDYNVIVIGAGNLGQAVSKYTNFNKRGYKVTALFDSNPALAGTTVAGYPVLDAMELADYLKENPTDIAVLTIPKAGAVETAKVLVEGGVKAIWNFASVDLDLPKDKVVVVNVHLSDSLRVLSYKLRELRGQEDSEEV